MIKVKQRKAEYPFVTEVFNLDLTKLHKDFCNIAEVGDHGRLHIQSLVKNLTTEFTNLVPLSYSHCSFRKMLIPRCTCFISCISLFTFQMNQLFTMSFGLLPHLRINTLIK